MTNSPRACTRRPSRVEVFTRMKPSWVSHQNRSRPSTRCGLIGVFSPIARSTCRVAASSSAICRPEFPPPITSTGPGGSDWGFW